MEKIRWGIRWKLLTVMVSLIIGILLALTHIQISSQKLILEKELGRYVEILRKNLIDRGKTITDQLARITENNIATYNLSNIDMVIRNVINENEELS